MLRTGALLGLMLAACHRNGPAAPTTEGAELLGTPAPDWEASDWIGSPPLTLAGLRGKVVLVRWFMSTDCPYCSASAPALRQLDADYRARGLVVVGMYHHKHAEPLDVEKVKGWVRDFGFAFPVAVDRDWRTLHRWWLDGNTRDFTSVSFLLDRRGTIRHIHPGGTMAPGSADFGADRNRELRAAGEVDDRLDQASPGRATPIARVAQEFKLKVENWDIDTTDWAAPQGLGASKIAAIRQQLERMHGGRLNVLLHVQPATARDLPQFIATLRSWGFSFAAP